MRWVISRESKGGGIPLCISLWSHRDRPVIQTRETLVSQGGLDPGEGCGVQAHLAACWGGGKHPTWEVGSKVPLRGRNLQRGVQL